MPLVSNTSRRQTAVVNAPAPYSDDVFTTLLYTGTGAAQNLYPGFTDMDLGVAFLSKFRNGPANVLAAYLWDSKRGLNSALNLNVTTAAVASALSFINPTNLSLGADSQNQINIGYVSWFFKIAKSFFTAIVYNGDNSPVRSVSHNLQCTPGMVVGRAVNGTSNWFTWHRAATGALMLHLPAAQAGSYSGVVSADASTATVDGNLNVLGTTYELLLFAHDVSDNGIIRCDKFTTDASGNATINLGWDIQFALIKPLASAGDWLAFDTTRGYAKPIPLNTTGTEITYSQPIVAAVSGGFAAVAMGASLSFVYIAIRKRNKPNSSPNTLTINGGNSIDVYARAIANGWDQVSPLSVIIAGDVGSDDTSTPALLFNGSYPDVTLTVNSGVTVAGRGGTGVRNQVGLPGGPALKTTGAIKIINNGTIGGGGGSGGGGSYSPTSYGYSGNGAGLPVLGAVTGGGGTQATAATKTNGGNGASGYGGNGGAGGAPGSNGQTGAGGCGGGGGLGGTGGTSSNSGPGYTFSDPGNQGQGGAGLTDSDPTANRSTTYTGGAPGPYAIGNANITWLTAGTRYGSAA